ncbi:formate dehydrogenase subunit gamma [Solemya velum gill symbiont]|uniref:formate dehydrogenase subunit gamma n=1 Tax=Solemya velum gill symbiont TaxID=2340 RepID=UPI0009968FDC|nr:formate dehydrogenase subunit gamma [Solemya velum gill symbiont]OOZ44584.1 formate dehydrogenase subunit gamma [Solemya velum gill symbiont]OOZ46768.1 formate dehydrogenase subunit gamma [Solemya velum gill symbiont]OOZ49223.1 formate dehydrogenase subunit gamma [Solemya velum gill symbiont]OOZ51577.1 formate dehydrogenase subunit gamma [Solemya velum gill symbiont]OOZ54231.1 formate dehydrogenase subunit gamma [Solemya velum gill symbiont]
MNVAVRHGLIQILVVIACLLLFAGSPVHAQSSQDDKAPVSPIDVPNPGAELWNAVRERGGAEPTQQHPLTAIWEDVLQQQDTAAKSQARSADATSMINASGDQWRQLRREQLIPYGGALLLLSLAIVIGLSFVKRTAHYSESDMIIRRFKVPSLVGHWLMAGSMLFLAFTGLVLLFGRFTLLPLTGSDFFSAFASASKEGHDLFGPIFTFALIIFFFQFVSKNMLHYRDFVWMARLGGLFEKKPLKAGFFNFGEKTLFWLVIFFGIALSVSGFAILFQNLLPGRDLMLLAILVHAVSAILLICLVIGHIFMALSTKGTMDAITTGDVDANWAKADHSVWYEQMKEAGHIRKRIAHASDDAGKEIPVAEVSAEQTGAS